MTRLLDISKVAEILGVDIKTLRRWDDEGKLKAVRTLGNHRRYREEDINTLINGEMQTILRHQKIFNQSDIKIHISKLSMSDFQKILR